MKNGGEEGMEVIDPPTEIAEEAKIHEKVIDRIPTQQEKWKRLDEKEDSYNLAVSGDEQRIDDIRVSLEREKAEPASQILYEREQPQSVIVPTIAARRNKFAWIKKLFGR